MNVSARRYLIVAVCSLAALWMYIDRTCFSTLSKPIAADLGIGPEWMPDLLAAFFLTYALFQIPVGLLADRFGPRAVLTGCIAGWSAVVAATAFADGVYTLLALRFALGAAEAGAYPTAAALVKRWAAPHERGRLSSFVALGGRVGGGIAPWLSSRLAVATLGMTALGPMSPQAEGNWRAVFLVFGVCGLVVAGLFWLVVRDHPPGATVERQLPAPPVGHGLFLLASSPNMWLSGVVQFLNNFGWAFVITLLPGYLKDVHHTTLADVGNMQSLPLFVGIPGMLLGGLLTDALSARFGKRRGRSLPICGAMCACAAAYVVCANAAGPWVVVAALCVMAFAVDLGNPSNWAFNQDVGGRYVGAALGWGNMIGNIGAFASAKVFAAVAAGYGWTATFYLAAGAFAVGAAAAAFLDASQPLERPASRKP